MSLLKFSPKFTVEEATALARDIYGVDATASALPSERDQNFLLKDQSGEKYVLKIANALEDRALLEAQQQAMARIAEHASLRQRIEPNRSGDLLTEFRSPSGATHFIWMVTWLPGATLGEIGRHSPELMRDFGRTVGQVDRALAGFDHPAIHRDFHWDLANGLSVIREYEPLITDVEMRRLVVQLADEFERDVAPVLPKLRKSAIHNDANDYNVIVGGDDDLYAKNQSVVGLIDFGDMIHSFTVADLAVAIAYAILDKADPLAAAAEIVRSYHAEYALTEDEMAVLFSLARLRLCMSVCIGAHQRRQRPGDDYLAVSQRPIRDTLPELAKIHPRYAEAVFRHACGLTPSSKAGHVVDWLQNQAQTFTSVLRDDLPVTPCLVLDLSIGSPLISGDERENSEPKLSKRIFDAMAAAGVKIGVGRYDEARLLYASPLFASGGALTDERRVVHLGIDLFTEAGAPVFAPIDGEVHDFAVNAAPLDYGHVIILKHRTSDGHEFYTLYGHLSAESLKGLSAGKPVAKGEKIASLGLPAENGGWTPHLHFQIITDLLDSGCDFPGVCRASQRGVWLSFSPDPNLILRIPESRFPPREPNKTETLAARHEYIGKNLSVAYREPVKIVRGWMQYLFDEAGRRYLDAYNNVPHVGHCHPRVVEAGQRQMATLNANTRYLHDLVNRYAEALRATLPDPLSVCFFVNSGSEANELALRLARAHTRRRDMIVLEAAYHGNTNTLIDISPYKHDGPGGTGAPSWVHTIPIPDPYRGHYRGDDPQAGVKYAQKVIEIIELLRENGAGLSGFIAESCPSVGGQIFFPEGYLAEVYASVRAAGGVCIADEIQTGYGRIGTHFYAFESQGVTPDIVALGKPIGNGHPIGAVITTSEIAESFANGMEFFSTFGGNTVSCAIGLATLEVTLEEELQSHASRVGDRLLEGLRRLMDRYAIVGDVRGSGLFLGLELVRDRETLDPASEEASYISDRFRECGILLAVDGPFHNVIKIRPPMPFSETDADLLVATMDRVLAEL
ncbi:MAG TPA: aminotransferase class III-fold pyridoxal phosphate-dependent enzyme [Blastocatellia bacterium]|nr:aminotransferase class III-fold pyridoxal phosphate-dependent enzyme [Blastocatellia bacterium]